MVVSSHRYLADIRKPKMEADGKKNWWGKNLSFVRFSVNNKIRNCYKLIRPDTRPTSSQLQVTRGSDAEGQGQ